MIALVKKLNFFVIYNPIMDKSVTMYRNHDYDDNKTEHFQIVNYTDLKNMKNNINEIKALETVFGKQINLDKISKEDIIFSIRTNKNIDWDAISEIRNLPEYIMSEFKTRIKWKKILFNRPMTSETVNKFKEHLVNIINYTGFMESLNDDNLHVLDIVIDLNKDLVPHILMHACKMGYTCMYNILVDNPIITDKNLYAACNHAYENDHIEIFRQLIMNPRVDSNIVNYCMVKSCETGNTKMIAVLIKHPNLERNALKCGLQEACEKNTFETIEYLNINSYLDDELIDATLIAACQYDAIRIIEYMFSNRNITPENLVKYFYISGVENSLVVLEYIYRNYDVSSGIDDTFHAACEKNNMGIFDILLADDRLSNDMVVYGLYAACKNGHKDIVIRLIHKPQITESHFNDAFQLACQNKHLDVVVDILSDPRILNEAVCNQFYLACSECFVENFKLLINNEHVKNMNINMGFEYACHKSSMQIIQMLIDNSCITENNLVNNYIDSISHNRNEPLSEILAQRIKSL